MTATPHIRRWLAFGLLLLLAVGCIRDEESDDIAATTLVHAGEQAPDFTVTMLDGSTTTLSALRGKVVLLTFWNTWCPECGREMAVVQQEIIDRFAGREFRFLPVAREEAVGTVAEFAVGNGYDFPIGVDPEGIIYGLYATKYVPRNILVDRNGTVVASHAGYTPETFAELVEAIELQLP